MVDNLGSDIPRRASYKKKIAKDFQRQKDIIDILDMWHGDYRNESEIEKFNINYDLLNGRLDIKLYDDPICIQMENEKVKMDDISITHYPLISQVASAILGEQILRPFKPLAKDTGEYSQTLRNKKFNELLRELIQGQIVNPIRDEVTTSYLTQIQNNPDFQLDEEQVQQMQLEIENRIKEKTPEDVLDFMANDFRTPIQRQAQQLMDYFVEFLDLKHLQNDGFKHALATGREVYRISEEHGEPVMILCNPKYITWGGSQNTEWVQDAAWCKYEQWLTIEEAQQKFAEELSTKTIDELKGFIEPIGGFKNVGDPNKDNVQRRMMIDLSTDPKLAQEYSDVNYKTKHGQKRITDLYRDIINKYGGEYGTAFSNYGVREAHFAGEIRVK